PMEQVPAAAFLAYDISAIELGEEPALEDLYITNRINRFNHFYIDDSGILWAYGSNEYGQLGIGKTDEPGIVYKEPVKVAEDVVSVDFSENSYFCIYLTGEGRLYGMGSNMLGLLGQELTDSQYCYSVDQYAKVPEPVLLMEDVSYARAGRESIVALKTDGSVWWWGQYRIPYRTRNFKDQDIKYWQPAEDEQNPAKMLYNSPRKLLDNCVYATTGDFTGAAITADGDLYTWGLNIFGECGTEVTGDDYVRHPVKVLEDVRMVWPERIGFDNVEKEISEDLYFPEYDFNLFVQLRDGTILAAGEGLGERSKTIDITGDLERESLHYYSDAFVPVRIGEYSERAVLEVLDRVDWGTGIEEAKRLLQREGIAFEESMNRENCLVIQQSSYFMYFEDKGRFTDIYLQRGGSRDGRFALGMTMEEVAEGAGCELEYVKNTDEDSFHACLYNGDRYYEFIFSVSGILYAVSEMEQAPF
ncbi:MAG: hypothetical protein K2O97_14115, partial [Acetatifactor sp.]|nr:hypothetical protein [Acetatifactor sp.]